MTSEDGHNAGGGGERSDNGKTFDALLASASDASAYGGGAALDASAPAQGSVAPPSGALPAVDVQRLGDALECLPLPRLLGLNADVLLPEQLADFERSARRRLQAFDERVKDIARSAGASSSSATAKANNKGTAATQAQNDLNRVLSSLPTRDEDEGQEDDDDEDDEDLNPNDIVDWLDKVLAK